MANLSNKFLRNTLRIGIYVLENEVEYFFGSVGRNAKGQIIYNCSIEWESRNQQKAKGFIPDSGVFMCTVIEKDEVKYNGIGPSREIFTHCFVVPSKQLSTPDSVQTVFHIELLPNGKQSQVFENPKAEIIQQESFNEYLDEVTFPSVVITHMKFHSSINN